MSELNLSKEAHIVDGIIASTLFQIRTDKLEDLKKTKDILNKRYYPEEKVQEFVKELKVILNMNGELTELQINYLAGDVLCTKDEGGKE